MIIDFTIDGFEISSIGFIIKDVKGNRCVPEPKKQGSVSEEFSSVNYFDKKYFKKSPEVTVIFFGAFNTIIDAEDALYTIYGKLTNPGEHVFAHRSGDKSVTFRGIMSGGATVEPIFSEGKIVFTVTLKLLKTL